MAAACLTSNRRTQPSQYIIGQGSPRRVAQHSEPFAVNQTEEFFSRLYTGQTGVLELRTFDHQQANHLRTFISVKDGQLDYTPVYKFLTETERLQLGAFFGVALRTQAALKTFKGDAAHCQTLTSLFVDADFKHLGEDITRSKIDAYPQRPSMIVNSGGGLHPYWPLSFPIFLQGSGGMVRAKLLLKRIAKSVADVVDESVSEPVRVLRIPGSFNFKKHYDKPRPVTLEFVSDEAPIIVQPPQPSIGDVFEGEEPQ
jgi:hypothetical protein